MIEKVINSFRRNPDEQFNNSDELTQLLEESKRKRTEAAREEYEKKHGKPRESKILKMLLANGTEQTSLD